MKKYSLKIEKRIVAGKKVKKLRKEGILPANIYGKNITSISVQVTLKEFEAVYKEAGETGLVELMLDGKIHPVLIHNVQEDYLTQAPVHADFYQVNLKEKVKTTVPVELIGEPKAVTNKLGLLLQVLDQIEIEALPTDLPEKFEVDVTSLAGLNDQVTVADIKATPGVTILTGGDETLAKISELVSKEAEAQAVAEAAAAEAAKITEGAEGTSTTAGAASPTAETKSTEVTKASEAKEEKK